MDSLEFFFKIAPFSTTLTNIYTLQTAKTQIFLIKKYLESDEQNVSHNRNTDSQTNKRSNKASNLKN